MRCSSALPILMLAAAGCLHAGYQHASSFPPGTRQDDVVMRLEPRDRVLFRDESMMIVQTPRGTRQLRFDDRGRLESDFPHGSPGLFGSDAVSGGATSGGGGGR